MLVCACLYVCRVSHLCLTCVAMSVCSSRACRCVRLCLYVRTITCSFLIEQAINTYIEILMRGVRERDAAAAAAAPMTSVAEGGGGGGAPRAIYILHSHFYTKLMEGEAVGDKPDSTPIPTYKFSGVARWSKKLKVRYRGLWWQLVRASSSSRVPPRTHT